MFKCSGLCRRDWSSESGSIIEPLASASTRWRSKSAHVAHMIMYSTKDDSDLVMRAACAISLYPCAEEMVISRYVVCLSGGPLGFVGWCF